VKLRAVALALLMIACTQQAVAPTPATPGRAGPPVVGDLPVTKIDFSCRLPVSKYTGGGDYVSYSSGFIALPTAAFSSDPNGGIHSRYLEQDFATDAAPTLYGVPQLGPPFYDLAQHRVVPVASAQSTADGASYAYTTVKPASNLTQVHVVNVGAATEKVFDVSQPERAQVADFGPAGVYLLGSPALGSPGEGVWLLNPASGAITRLRSVTHVMAVRDGFAWIGRIDPRDHNPPPSTQGTPSNSIVRLDLQSGAETVWSYRPGASLWLRGFDSRGKPVIGVVGPAHYNDGEIRLVEQPGTQGVLVYPGGLSLTGPQGDGDRLWFGGASGIYLYAPARGLRKVFAYSANPISEAEGIQPAGFCR
jgi:hypothetical protein